MFTRDKDMASHVAYTYEFIHKFTQHVIYTVPNLAVEASYTILKINYWHNKSHYTLAGGMSIAADYIVISVTLYFVSIETPNKINGKHAASNWRAAPLSHFSITEHCLVFMHFLNNICNANVSIIHIAINNSILPWVLNKGLI